MTREEFKKYIESIGFKKYVIDLYDDCYEYKSYKIYLYNNFYSSEWSNRTNYNDLTPLENEFKQELRSIKLKKILG